MSTAAALERVTGIILDDMQRSGWFGEGREKRFDRPTPRDINNGNCEEWAKLAVANVGGQAVWLDTFKTTATWCHCVLYLNGYYYDSIHPNGSRTLREFIAEAKQAYRAFVESQPSSTERTDTNANQG